MLINKIIDGLKLNNDIVIANKIRPKVFGQYLAFVGYMYCLFSLIRYVSQLKLFFKCFLINGLSKSTANNAVYLHSCTNNSEVLLF